MVAVTVACPAVGTVTTAWLKLTDAWTATMFCAQRHWLRLGFRVGYRVWINCAG